MRVNRARLVERYADLIMDSIKAQMFKRRLEGIVGEYL